MEQITISKASSYEKEYKPEPRQNDPNIPDDPGDPDEPDTPPEEKEVATGAQTAPEKKEFHNGEKNCGKNCRASARIESGERAGRCAGNANRTGCGCGCSTQADGRGRYSCGNAAADETGVYPRARGNESCCDNARNCACDTGCTDRCAAANAANKAHCTQNRSVPDEVHAGCTEQSESRTKVRRCAG